MSFAVDHRRELEQRVAVVHPQPLERRAQRWRGRGRSACGPWCSRRAARRSGSGRGPAAWASAGARSARAGGRCCRCGCARRGSRRARRAASSDARASPRRRAGASGAGEQAPAAGSLTGVNGASLRPRACGRTCAAGVVGRSEARSSWLAAAAGPRWALAGAFARRRSPCAALGARPAERRAERASRRATLSASSHRQATASGGRVSPETSASTS